MSTSKVRGAQEVSWVEARERLALVDRENVFNFQSWLGELAEQREIRRENVRVVLVGSVLTKGRGEYNDIDLIVLPTQGYELGFDTTLRSCMYQYRGRDMNVVEMEHIGDCYEDKEGWLLTMKKGKPLHILTFHPLGHFGCEYVSVAFEDFMAFEAEKARTKPRHYAIITPPETVG